jgi:predicted nucleotidyltransferase component of viral defense system
MIPAQNVIAWGNIVPWADLRQIEQDLIISRALVDIFSDPLLRAELRFRGGTALNKLHFAQPLRYSEDIDLVRTSAGPIGPILDRLRAVLEPWLGRAQFDQSPVAPKLRFRIEAEDGSGVPIRLKVEINTREIEAFDPPAEIAFTVANPWFTGEVGVPTFSREEMMATKLRALLQRDKGRDLFDLAHALDSFDGMDESRVVTHFRSYLALSGQAISRAQAQERMFAKLANPRFLLDMRPLLPAAQAEALSEAAANEAWAKFFARFIDRLPGDPWVRTAEMKERFGLAGAAASGQGREQ